jgi:uncharacterized cupin superfamily protein
MRPVANVHDVELKLDEGDPPGYGARYARLGPLLGGGKLGMTVYELPPGESICPYHYEVTEEEWLICLAGAPLLRTADGERALEPGDVVCFPAGPAGGHKVTAGAEPARVAICSTIAAVGVTVYPDSRKLGVWHQGERHMVRLEPQLDYWDGETESRNAAT